MASFLDLLSGKAKQTEQAGQQLILNLLGQARQSATNAFSNNPQQVQQRQQFYEQNIRSPILNKIDTLPQNTLPVKILHAGAKLLAENSLGKKGSRPNLPPNKPYSQWTPEEKKRVNDNALNMAIMMSGGMGNVGEGKVVPEAIAAVENQAPKLVDEGAQALAKFGEDATKALRQSNPKGLLTESLAQTAFRREAKLLPGQVYDAAKPVKTVLEKYTPFSPEQGNVVANWGKDVKTKVNLLDYFRTPENVLQKIGLGNEAQGLRTGWEAYKKELPQELNKITDWMKQVPGEDASKRIFNFLDGKKVDLAPHEQEVANQVKGYLKGWADKLKLPQEKRVSDYITHIFDKGQQGTEFDPELAKLIDNKVPGAVYDPFLQKRSGVPNYVQDTWRALDAYTKRAVRKYHMDEPLNALSKTADNLDLESYKYVQRYGARINMRPTEIDNLVDNFIKQTPIGYKATARPTAYLTGKFRQQVYRGALGLNIGSALRNLTQGVNTYAKLGERYTATGYVDLFKRMATNGLDELYQNGVLDDAILQDRTPSVFKGILKKADEGLFKLFDTAELINRGAAYFGAKKQAIAKGLSEPAAVDAAKQVVRDTQFAFGALDTPVAMSGDIVKTLAQFKSFDVKELEFLAKMAKNKEWGGLVRYIGSSLVVAHTVGKLMGFDWKNFVPFSNARFDSPATQIGSSALQMLSPNEATRSQAKGNLLKSAALLIPAGVQAKKTLEGIQAYQQGASQTPSGRKRFDVQQTPENLFRSAVFGQYSLPQAQEYFKNLDLGKSQSEVAFEKWKELAAKDQKEAQAFARTLSPSMQGELRNLYKEDQMGITKQEKQWKTYTVDKRANEIAKELSQKGMEKGSKARADKVARWKQLGIISDQVYKQLLYLQKQGVFK